MADLLSIVMFLEIFLNALKIPSDVTVTIVHLLLDVLWSIL